MQPQMSDKELDLLFQQQFEGFQPEVSPALWNRITDEMGEGKEKTKGSKKFPIAWMAAASVLILLSAGLWIMESPQPVIKLRGKGKEQLAQAVPAGTVAPVTKPEETVKQQEDSPARQVTKILAKSNLAVPVKQFAKMPAEEIHANQTKPETQLFAAAQNPDETAEEHAVHVPAGIQSVDLKNTFRANTSLTAPVLASAMDPVSELPKKRIKSLSGLVNYVVGKVDRREDKLIEMKDGDEGTEVSGINLGLFKIKNKNNTSNTTHAPQ